MLQVRIRSLDDNLGGGKLAAGTVFVIAGTNKQEGGPSSRFFARAEVRDVNFIEHVVAPGDRKSSLISSVIPPTLQKTKDGAPFVLVVPRRSKAWATRQISETRLEGKLTPWFRSLSVQETVLRFSTGGKIGGWGPPR